MSGIRLALLITRRLYGLPGGFVQPPNSPGCQDQCRGQRSRFMILGPGWSDRLSKAGDAALDPAGCVPECRLGFLVELSLPDGGDRNLQIFTSLANGVAEEFA